MPQAPSIYGTQPPTDTERQAHVATHQNNPAEHPNYAHAGFPRMVYKDPPVSGDPVLTTTAADETDLAKKLADGWREHPTDAPVTPVTIDETEPLTRRSRNRE